jgi:hypothetical protein
MDRPSLVDVLTGIEHCWARGLLWRLDVEASTRAYMRERAAKYASSGVWRVSTPGSRVPRAGR